jgi:exo-beta-1,3-glucanase (GH17 family)
VAICYSPYRKGQHPDRGAGAIEPSDAEILEDLKLLSRDNHFPLLRLYDAKENAKRILTLIRDHGLPMKVMLGAWLNAEVSTYGTCAWITEPEAPEKLAANAVSNVEELDRAIALANAFPEVVVAVNVGNEVLVDWNDHRVSVEALVGYIEKVKAAIKQPVTVADNYVPWTKYPAVGKAVDFAAVHTYPVWEGKAIDEGLSFTVENLAAVQAANPGLPIAIGEAGWASVAVEFGERASPALQARYYEELMGWGAANNVTVFFFEAFDESWKGHSGNPMGAEKHWGLFDEDRRPKAVVQALYPDLAPSDR